MFDIDPESPFTVTFNMLAGNVCVVTIDEFHQMLSSLYSVRQDQTKSKSWVRFIVLLLYCIFVYSVSEKTKKMYNMLYRILLEA